MPELVTGHCPPGFLRRALNHRPMPETQPQEGETWRHRQSGRRVVVVTVTRGGVFLLPDGSRRQFFRTAEQLARLYERETDA